MNEKELREEIYECVDFDIDSEIKYYNTIFTIYVKLYSTVNINIILLTNQNISNYGRLQREDLLL